MRVRFFWATHTSMKNLLLSLFCLGISAVSAQEFVLDWSVLPADSSRLSSSLILDNGAFNEYGLPIYTGEYELPIKGNAHIELFSPEVAKLTSQEVIALGDLVDQIGLNFDIQQANTYTRGKEYVSYRILPIRRNQNTNEFEKLTAFDLMVVRDDRGESFKTSSWALTSELATGNWIKMPVTGRGLHVVSVNTLASAGIITLGAPSSTLHAYHNGGGPLPESISASRFDDLRQIPLRIEDGGDGVLNAGDNVYFYAEGPHKISYDSSNDRLLHTFNVYARESYVFFTSKSQSNGLRLREEAWTGGSATTQSQGFDELQFHELDLRNVVGTGRTWYGEIFDFQLTTNLSFDFPNRIQGDPILIRYKTAVESASQTTQYEVREGGVLRSVLVMNRTNSRFPLTTSSSSVDYISGSGDVLDIDLTFNRAVAPSATGYLDYLSIQSRRQWIYSAGGFVASDLSSVAPGGVVQYTLSDPNAWVWDVTDPTRPFAPQRNSSGIWFAPSDSLRTYSVFTPGDAVELTSYKSVGNQDLHAFEGVDMIIVSHPNFLSEAQRLKDLHTLNDNLNTEIVTPEEIYNEFSCGAQDVTAIRDFMRMLYKRDASDPLEHLLLMGDASYDYLNRVPNMQNFVPVYQSVNSVSLYTSFMSDDYYAQLDDGEGTNVTFDKVDINTGRLPVKTIAEAQAVVDKIVDYAVSDASFGDWRNRVTFITDDVDEDWEDVLTIEPERIARMLDTVYPTFNMEKIYSDSYTQVSSSGSQSYPSAREAIYRSVQRGNLVTAYTGHGGEVGWASERLLQLPDVNRWTNRTELPLFVTITCEFTRFDDPFRTSAGEQVMLNPNGGGIGLISTTRVVFVDGAVDLNEVVFETIFEKENGEYPTLGDVVRRAKNAINASDRVRFSLIGDPALRLNIPVHEVILDSINGVPTAQVDTIKARETVTLDGRLFRDQGGLFNDFNGEVVVTVFDKIVQKSTRRNDGEGAVVNFSQQENIIFRGRATVENGYWTISFIVPRDINYTYGQGKISLYADNGVTDAAGANKTFYVGGLGDQTIADDEGPEIRLFMNDTNFVNGGLTDENPVALALLYDESGINVVGNGLGHDVVGVLDEDFANSFRLNAYYQGDLDTYKSGTIEYPFFDLDNGPHTLDVRVWDVMNNVSETRVHFVVAERDNLQIEDLFNYPNPFSTETNFSFEHNRPGEELEIQLFIMDLNGRIVHHQKQDLTPEGSRTLDMKWDGSGSNGAKVSNGLYVFRLVVRSKADGEEAEQSERLVYLK